MYKLEGNYNIQIQYDTRQSMTHITHPGCFEILDFEILGHRQHILKCILRSTFLKIIMHLSGSRKQTFGGG